MDSIPTNRRSSVEATTRQTPPSRKGPRLCLVPLLVAAGLAATPFAIAQTGTVVAWGDNSEGQTNVPAQALSEVVAIAAGRKHSLAVRRGGTVVAWGDNADGQTTVPAQALSGVVAVAAGWGHSLALKGGGVVAWGDNTSNQTDVPAQALSGVTAIAAGGSHSLALKGGTVVAWGSNAQGQTNVPPTLSGAVAIAAGHDHSLALKGGVVAWGSNGGGQTTVPAQARSGVMAIAAGPYHSLALRDATRPAVKITGPKTSGKYPSSRKIQIKGKATDNVGLARWEYKLNNGTWKKGGNLSGKSRSWKKSVGKVKAGTNRVQVRTYDWGGLVSKVAKRSVRLSQPVGN